jgi:FKBP-type peptidyl-prolyl cis-trans isomerase FkpA
MNRASVLILAAAVAAGVPAAADEHPKLAVTQKAPAASDAAKETPQEFLAKVDADKSVQKKSSGLRIKIVKEGSGANPTAADTVKVHYRGTLTDGTEFDSSYKRDMPATFPLRNVIPCWTEGVQLIKTGGKATLYCPSEIAYGERGHPPVIPPSATLVFDVELLEIVGSKAPAPAPK